MPTKLGAAMRMIGLLCLLAPSTNAQRSSVPEPTSETLDLHLRRAALVAEFGTAAPPLQTVDRLIEAVNRRGQTPLTPWMIQPRLDQLLIERDLRSPGSVRPSARRRVAETGRHRGGRESNRPSANGDLIRHVTRRL